MSTPSQTRSTLRLGACCACGIVGPVVRHLFYLPLKGEVPGCGWGCAVCRLPHDGAVVVLCDNCLDTRTDPTHACRGFPATDGRISIAALTVPHLHDETLHEAESHLRYLSDMYGRKRMSEMLQEKFEARCGVGNSPAGPVGDGDPPDQVPAGEAACDASNPFWRGPFFRGAEQV